MNAVVKAHLEGKEAFEKLWFDEHGKPFVFKRNAISFLTTYGTNLLKAALEAGPGERLVNLETDNEKFTSEELVEVQAYRKGHNSCLSSYRSAIDEGIEGIKNN